MWRKKKEKTLLTTLMSRTHPHDLGPSDHSAARAASEAHDFRTTENQVKAVETQVPEAHVVRVAHANHYVFVSNEQDVLREMNSFITKLLQSSQ